MLLVWLIFIPYYTNHWYEGISVFKILDVTGTVLEGKQIDSKITTFTYNIVHIHMHKAWKSRIFHMSLSEMKYLLPSSLYTSLSDCLFRDGIHVRGRKADVLFSAML